MPLWKLGVSALTDGYRLGEIDPVDVLDETEARIAAVNPVLNAIVTLDSRGAAEAARASAARWRAGQPLGPLDGIPITVKDNIQVKGLRCTWGSRLFANHVPEADETPVARLRAGGAVILGKTNAPEFTLQGYTDNEVFGATGNPWNPDLTPGGSSGGAVAAVASGMGVVGIGTDGGGSIRRPAAHTGLYGFKPSPGLVGRSGGLPAILRDFETMGPVARSAEDLRATLDVLGGADPDDRASMMFPTALRMRGYRCPNAPRILYVPRFGTAAVDPHVAASVDAAANMLARLGCRIDGADVPFELERINAIWGLIGPVGLAWLMKERDVSHINRTLHAMVRTGVEATAIELFDMLAQVDVLRAQLDRTFQSHDFIMTPSVAALPWPKHDSHPGTIDGMAVGPRGHAVFTAFANAGGLPAINIPCAPSPDGRPIGFQLVGPFADDMRLLDMAELFETSQDTHRWPDL